MSVVQSSRVHYRKSQQAATAGAARTIVGVILLALASPAFADDSPENAAGPAGVVAYPASFYEEFRPGSARDMIDRTPGFAIQGGEDVRGYAGSSGNVLIDGARPATKSVPLEQQLQRIPASSVERIEIIRSGTPGVEMLGQTMLANIVRKQNATASKSAQAVGKFYGNGFVGKVVRGETSWRGSDLAVEGQGMLRTDLTTDSGSGEIVRGRPAGFDVGSLRTRAVNDILQLNGAAEHRGSYGLLRLNVAGERKDTDRADDIALRLSTGSSATERVAINQRDMTGEFGAEHVRQVTPALSLKLLGLARNKSQDQKSNSATSSGTQLASGDFTTNESIARAVLRWEIRNGLTLEGGAEAAFNSLDARSTLTTNGLVVNLPSANVRVEERRAEGFATATWRWSNAYSVESGLRLETSTIKQSGAIEKEKTLTFPKPRLLLSWSSAGMQARLRLERTVGQLNFNDFAASSELDLGTVNAGNANLEPERAWLAEIGLERRFGKGGAITASISRARVEKIVDLVPVSGVFDAPGNIGSGTRTEAKLGVTLPLESIGVTGAQLRVNGTWRNSQVDDPVTGARRRISLERPFEGELFLTKSLPRWRSAAGLEGGFGYRETAYRINEIRTTYEAPLWKAYWDWTPRTDLLLRLQCENFSDRLRARERTVFAGSRAVGVPTLQEHREARLSRIYMLRVRKIF